MSARGATPADFPRSAAAADRLGPGPLRHVAETGSTNTDLADEARRGCCGGAVLVADHQTAGRGRLDRVWEDDPGAGLLVSFRVPVGSGDATEVVAAVSAAARAAVDALIDASVLSKWPNDLVVLDPPAPGKLGGVLAEFVAGPEPVVVVGLGVNVAPVDRAPGSTSMAANGGPADRDRLLAAVLEELAPRLRRPDDVLDEMRAHSATVGTDVRVELPGGEVVEGHAVRIADNGNLVVRPADGLEVVVATGDVVHLRPA